MNEQRIQSGLFILVALLMVLSAQPGMAQEEQTPEGDESSTSPRFGSPNSVQDQLADDATTKENLTGVSLFQRYFDWKGRLREDNGFSFSVDYTAGIIAASETLGDKGHGSAGAVRFFGAWDLVGRESGNTGTFVWKVENRHKYIDPPASGMASEMGYVGAILPVLSNMGNRMTNLYWKQNLNKGRLEFILGLIDTTDWVDVYALASPWTGFFNFAFATGSASIPVPDDAAVGMYVNAMLTNNLYVIGGMADANANSTDPFAGFDTFFNDNEYFSTIEFGWTTSQDRFYLDNTHLTFWHVDERVEAGVSGGNGGKFSFTRAFGVKWMPFLRAGYANDGGSVLQKTLSTGLGYHLKDDTSLLGLGLNWGQPNEDTFGSGLNDQFTTELFCRLQMTQNIQITPDIQYIKNPALNPDADQSWALGLRGRIAY